MSPVKKDYWLWALAGVTVVLLITVVILVVVGANILWSAAGNINFNFTPAPPPKNAAEFAAPPPKISRFATDSAVLQLKSDLIKLRSSIDSVDIFEPQLSQPNIDLNISIMHNP